jgi:hypothetical protein
MTRGERLGNEGEDEVSGQRYFHCQFVGLKFTLMDSWQEGAAL